MEKKNGSGFRGEGGEKRFLNNSSGAFFFLFFAGTGKYNFMSKKIWGGGWEEREKAYWIDREDGGCSARRERRRSVRGFLSEWKTVSEFLGQRRRIKHGTDV